ncbi:MULTISPECIES: response regulator transcription factor [Thermocrispum]|jgi:two-component system response regulator DevR|uniref:DNA-binding response regulator n=1 Tax=Thermocrispum agreste TaxID=37925 RepID=A0A2W4LGW6_9PSEU|nr:MULTISPECIES: response regulator transcription factor [Thermocrispum]PZM94876.1 MAG: DNA-binding response regulator [Thermocrispum agreste]
MIEVFVVDDHEIARLGVASLLEEQPDMTVTGQASTARQALARIPALRPDVAVLDVRLPDGDGVELCRELRGKLPELKCLMLTSSTDEQAMLEAVLAGAAGYVVKDIRSARLVEAIRLVAAGQSLLDARASAVLLRRLRGDDADAGPLKDLSDRERELLELIGEGLTNRQIAERMYLAEKTVKNYVSRLLAKLGMRGRAQLAALAVRQRGAAGKPPPGLG